MISGVDPNAQIFLADLARVQSQINNAERQVSSGLKVSQPSDAPDELPGLLHIRADLARNSQVSTNLAVVKSETDSAESVLEITTRIIDRVITLGAQGANTTQSAASRQAMAQEVQGLLEQLVGLSQTTVQGRYVFSGDQPQQPSYSLDLAAANGVDRLLTTVATRQIQDAAGVTFTVGRTAQDVFDHRNPDDSLASDNLFAAVNSLRVSLENNDEAGISAALPSLRQAGDYVNTQLSFYGSVQKRIQDATDFASKQNVLLQAELSRAQDADITQAALELAQGTTRMNAALGAESKRPRTSLFDFLA